MFVRVSGVLGCSKIAEGRTTTARVAGQRPGCKNQEHGLPKSDNKAKMSATLMKPSQFKSPGQGLTNSNVQLPSSTSALGS
jgi:hypothetical protein